MAVVTTAAFGAMGTTCDVTIVGGDEQLVAVARRRVEELERRWSRFRADSEISRLNDRAGTPTGLSGDSYLLVDRALEGWRWTSGLYDPTVLHALEAAGYDRSFEQIGDRATRSDAEPAPGCAGIVLDPALRAVTLPLGVGFDPGGIGKGLASDLVVALLLAHGAAGACVNIGGDGRVGGEPPPGGWKVGVASPHDEDALVAVLTLANEGIATSSQLMRRWTVAGAVVHHLLDPRTGHPVQSDVATATVVDREAWMAEVLSKAVFVAGTHAGAALLAGSGAAGLVVQESGMVHALGRWEALADGPAQPAVAAVPK